VTEGNCARATYAKNFFEAGGIATVTNDGFANRDQMAAAFKASGAALACLCSSDEVYAGEAEAAAQMLRAAGASRAVPARGKPRSPPPGSAASSIGCDVLAMLRAVHGALGIA
jgi:methylmalonyl-CoA mutase